MTPSSRQNTGREGEDLAAAYLESKGYTILERNYFFERSEVDLVAYGGQYIVFVEVKTRKKDGFGSPEDAVTSQKKKNIFKAAEAWLYERKMDGAPVRFDVVTIQKSQHTSPDIKHFEGAFWYND